MSTTTLTVGSGTIGSSTELTASGSYDIVVDGFGGVLDESNTGVTATITTITENGQLFFDQVSGGAVQDFNPTTLNSVIPEFKVGVSSVGNPTPGFGTLVLGNDLVNAVPQPSLIFAGTNNEVILAGSLGAGYLAGISGFAYTDTIDLQGVTSVASAVWTQNSGTVGGTLSLLSSLGADLGDLTLNDGTFTTSQFSITTDSVGGSVITVACYRAGTAIATPCGEIAVEQLAIGDRVLTADGQSKPVKWLGRRSYSGRFAVGKAHLQPIRFAAGALGNGRPRRDLWVSPQHAMLIDGALIPAVCLVNGVSIVQETGCARIDYVHVELEGHDVIFAEGAASETYINDDSRTMFHNAPEYAARYGDDAISQAYCAARIEDGPVLAAVRARLEHLAGIGEAEMAPGALNGWLERIERDRDGTYAVGWATAQHYPALPVCFELLLGGRVIHRFIANIHRPDVEDAGFGSGRCGFRVAVPPGTVLGDLVVRRIADRAVLPSALARTG